MQTLPGVIATYYRDGNHFVLNGLNKTPASEKAWWQAHGRRSSTR